MYFMIYDMIYLLTAIGLTPGGNSTQNNKMTQNAQNGTCITIRIHKKYRIKQKRTKHTTIYTVIQNRTRTFL